jgi:hypothetical protein
VEYLAACGWIREHTPSDAIFLVPPSEQAFRLRAQRAIVVNFKCVPQLSGELAEWRDRMCDVMDMPSLRALPKGFTKTIAAIRERYDSLSAPQLAAAAKKYNARYILATHPLKMGRCVYENTSWFLYDLAEQGGRLELSDVRKQLLAKHNLRVQENMAKYVASRLNQSSPINVIGGDARTGVPVAKTVDPKTLVLK